MKGDDSFDSEQFSFSDNDSENNETKERTSNNEKNEENEIKNMDLIKSITQILESILADNKRLINYSQIIKKQSKTVFNSRIIPDISIEKYLIRIQTYTNLERNSLIAGLIYIDRFCKISKIILTYNNIHKILFTSMFLSIKFNEDLFYENKYYAEIAGINLNELITLEYHFVNVIKFLFYIKTETFKDYKKYLEEFI